MKNSQCVFAVWLLVLFSGRLLAQFTAPTNLAGTAPAYNRVVLTWRDNSTGETKFEIERNNFTTFAKIGEVGANVTTYTDNSVGGGTYRVRAVFATGASAYSNEFTISTPPEPPGAPTGLALTLQGSSIRLVWNNGSGGTATDYQIERSNNAGNGFVLIQTVAYSRTPAYTDNGIASGTQYCYRVRARNTGGTSGYSNVPCLTTPLAPTNVVNLQAQALSGTSIKLTWNRYGKESGIAIERRQGQNGNWARIATTLADGGEYTDNSGLSPGTEYCYRIYEDGHDYSSVACATTPQVAPTAPARLVATVISSTQIDLQWADLANNETGFEVERASVPGGPFTKIADLGINTQTYSDRNLTPNTQYCYRVQAKNSSGGSGFSNTVCATTPAPPVPPPAAPANLVATAVSSSQINLNWTDNATNETGFELERSTDGTNFTKIADLRPDITTYQNTGLNPATRYYYRVRAINQGGQSAYSNVADATTADVVPNAPARLTAQATSFSAIVLNWADLSNNETGFQIERALSSTGTFTKIADVGANATTYTDAGLNGSTPYCYRIRAMNAVGAGAYSDVVCATTPAAPVPPPSAPTALVATAVSSATINLSWTDNAANETGYEIERSADGTNFTKIADVPANTTTYQSVGLNPATRYYYRVRAVNQGGGSAYSNVADATTADVPPAAPARLVATAVSSTQINLQWADLSGNETGFQVERSADGTNFTKIADVGANVTTYQNTGLTFLTKYYYRVRAVNAIGQSAYSNVADATTLPPPVPVAPQNLTAVATDFDRIRLNWSASTDIVSGYVLERALSPAGTFTVVAEVAFGTNSYLDTGLQEQTVYYYRLRAKNVAGASPYSNLASAKTEEMVVAVRKEPVAPMWQVTQLGDEALIQFAPEVTGLVPITIYDLQGRPRQTQTVRVMPGRQVSVSTISLNGALFIMTADTNKGLLRHKLMKP
ncbi:fibronectin type III domain-containing protein [Arsenicibacter rosenii]|uniref:Fibronectin type-III domain-containing protein n=1 Tax=Arsenicibacter rosenii TaxID=1750698 RepID=A0A1S2VKR2_9BACT|nr:fibronectin type III domain-containing protein [Arsenicibacter rosenii]OIN59329.1 hypothetical protein BLX24_10125 [Arsenicibacter rosenii]